MTLELLIRYLHFVGIIAIAGSLISEHMVISTSLKRKEIKKLAAIDAVYGLAAIIMVATGLTMWFGVGKGATFYTSNGFLHIKLTLFVIIAILSIFPTIFFLKNRKGDPEDIIEVPKKYIMYIRIEILLLILIPIFAVLIARGINP